MRARAGDPPRPMTQKILAAHVVAGNTPSGEGRVRVDQVVLTSPPRIRAIVARLGSRKLAPELSIAYAPAQGQGETLDVEALVAKGFSVGRPGAGFAAAVHLERFASPARIALTDDPRLASLGAAGMIAIAASDDALVEALVTGTAEMPPLVTLRVEITGRLRPFTSASDTAFELARSAIPEAVTAARAGASQLVLEMVGPSVRFFSVQERAQLAAMAHRLGALAAIFPADERMVAFLGDERRSKAHRVLADDTAAVHEGNVTFDLGSVEALLGSPSAAPRPIRELGKANVVQVILGGDVGASYRELLTVAALLKSKRVPKTLDFLVAAPSRQALEILSAQGALRDLVACGARIVEPDPKLLTGELYAPPPGCDGTDAISVVSFVESGQGSPGRFTVGPEALALAVATGHVADPRAWKRPARVTLPRTLPTDDVLLVRGRARAR